MAATGRKKKTAQPKRRKKKKPEERPEPVLVFAYHGKEYRLSALHAWLCVESSMTRHTTVNESNQPTPEFLSDLAIQLEQCGLKDCASTQAYVIWMAVAQTLPEPAEKDEDHELTICGKRFEVLDAKLAMQAVEAAHKLPETKYLPTMGFCEDLAQMLRTQGAAGCTAWEAYVAWRRAAEKMMQLKKTIGSVRICLTGTE